MSRAALQSPERSLRVSCVPFFSLFYLNQQAPTDGGTVSVLTQRLRLAADYLTEHGWVQGTEKDSSGRVCLTGAVRY